MTSVANRPRRHAVLCGISEYGSPHAPLPAVLDELDQLEHVLRDELHGEFRYDDVRVCKNAELTASGIELLFDSLADQAHVDEMFIYVAGTGTIRNGCGYFVTYNAPRSPPGLRLDELAALLAGLPCKRIFVVLDFCHAGKLVEEGDKVLRPASDRIAILAACRSSEVAASGTTGIPSFTGHVLTALRSESGRDDGIVRWGDVTNHVCAAMERSAHQRPVDRSELLRGHPVNQHQAKRLPAVDAARPAAKGASGPDDRVLHRYLDHVIKSFTLLDLRGLSGTQQNIEIPLDHVYVDLQAEPDNPTERDYDRRLVELDIHEYLTAHDLDGADVTVLEEATHRVLSRDAYALRVSQSGRRNAQGQPLPQGDHVVPLAEVIRSERRAIVLGDPGCGKTTLLRFCALHFAKAMREGQPRVSIELDPRMSPDDPEHAAETQDLGPTRLPIFIRIAAYAEARKQDPELRILDFLPRYWKGEQLQLEEAELSALFRHYIDSGQVLLLFDGLDEIAKLHERRDVVRQVEQFVAANVPALIGVIGKDRRGRPITGKLPPVEAAGSQVLITSRIAGYRIVPFRESLTHYTVQDMSDVAIDAFLRRWCQAIEARQGEERSRADQLARAERQRLALLDAIALPQLRRLAVNPLLLTLLALLNRSQGRLPRLRIEIYRNVTRTLVETWRDSALTEDEVIDVLGPVALRIHEDIHTGLATRAQLDAYLTDALAAWRGEDPAKLPGSFKREVNEFLDTIRRESGLLLARGEGLYGFAHLTFQEYFVARQITRKPADAAGYITSRLTEARWREPLLLAIAQVAKEARGELPGLLEAALAADVAHDDLLHRRLLFVASVFPECAWVPKALARSVCDRLLDVYTQSYRSGRLIALRGRIAAVYAPLRGSQVREPAEACLLAALGREDEVEQVAARELIEKSRWFTKPVLESVLERLRAAPRPAMLTLLAEFERDALTLFDELPSPLGRAADQRPQAWSKLLAAPAIRDLVLLLCTSTVLEDTSDDTIREHLSWSSPLSPLLIKALEAEAPVETLRGACQMHWMAGDGLAGWAGLVLRMLGETLPKSDARQLGLLAELLDVSAHRAERWADRLGGSIDLLLSKEPVEHHYDYILRALDPVAGPIFHSLLNRALGDPDSFSFIDLDEPEPHEGANIITFFIMRAVTRFRLAREFGSRPVSAPPLPKPTLNADPPFDIARVRSLVKSLYSSDDTARTRAATELSGERSMSSIGAEVVVELSSAISILSRSTHPLRGFAGTTLANAMANIEYDDPQIVKQWIDTASEETDGGIAARTCISYCGRISTASFTIFCSGLQSTNIATRSAAMTSMQRILSIATDQQIISMEADVNHTLPTIMLNRRAKISPAPLHLTLDDISLHTIVSMKHLTGALPTRLLDAWRSAQVASLETKAVLAAGIGIAAGISSVRAAEIDSLLRHNGLVQVIEDVAHGAHTLEQLASAIWRVLPTGVNTRARAIVALAGARTRSVTEATDLLRNWASGDHEFLDPAVLLTVVDSARETLHELTMAPDPELVRVGHLGLLLLDAYGSEDDDPDKWSERLLDDGTSFPFDAQTNVHIVFAALVPGRQWRPAKARIAALGARLVEAAPQSLLTLRDVLRANNNAQQRMAIYGQFAALATYDSSFLNDKRYFEFGDDLISGCRDLHDWQCRKSAIEALGRLRHLDRNTGTALLHLCKDIESVRTATLTAARSFQTFDAEVLDELIPALTDPSVRTAATVATLLATLATGRRTSAELRETITSALADACGHPSASRPNANGNTLSEHFYEALLEVTG